MDIHNLIQLIRKWDNTLVGSGYKHPEYPNESLKDETLRFFQLYPKLQSDKNYQEFIEYYSGILVVYPNHEIDISIFGLWSDYVTNVLYEPIIEADRFFTFASIVINPPDQNKTGATVSDFAFDLHNIKNLPVYCRVMKGKLLYSQRFKYYCSDFITWIVKLYEASGRLEAE